MLDPRYTYRRHMWQPLIPARLKPRINGVTSACSSRCLQVLGAALGETYFLSLLTSRRLRAIGCCLIREAGQAMRLAHAIGREGLVIGSGVASGKSGRIFTHPGLVPEPCGLAAGRRCRRGRWSG